MNTLIIKAKNDTKLLVKLERRLKYLKECEAVLIATSIFYDRMDEKHKAAIFYHD